MKLEVVNHPGPFLVRVEPHNKAACQDCHTEYQVDAGCACGSENFLPEVKQAIQVMLRIPR